MRSLKVEAGRSSSVRPILFVGSELDAEGSEKCLELRPDGFQIRDGLQIQWNVQWVSGCACKLRQGLVYRAY
jgi:hypothetical protein